MSIIKILLSTVVFLICCNAESISNVQVRDLNSPAQCSLPTVAADPDLPLGLVFASCEHGIIGINGTQVWTVVPSSVPGCLSPQGLVVHAGFLYATCFAVGVPPDTPTVIRVNFSAANWEVFPMATFEQCASPRQLDVDRTSGLVYVTCFHSVIQLDGRRISSIIPQSMCHYPTFVRAITQIRNGESTIYIGCNTDPDPSTPQPSLLLAFNSTSNSVTPVATLDPQCTTPMAIVSDWNSGALYVSCLKGGDANEGAIVVVRGSNVSTVMAGNACPRPVTLAFDSVSGFIFCNCDILRTVAFDPSAPLSSLTTLIDANVCENVRSMQLVSGMAGQRSFHHTSSTFSLLVGCKNSAAIKLISGEIMARYKSSVQVTSSGIGLVSEIDEGVDF